MNDVISVRIIAAGDEMQNWPEKDSTADSTLILRNADDIQALNRSRLLYSKQPLAIHVPGLSSQAAEALGERLNQYRSECGCSFGARSMVAGFVAVLALLLLEYGPLTSAFFWRLPLAFLFAVICAGIGKLAGIRLARRRLRRELDHLARASLRQA